MKSATQPILLATVSACLALSCCLAGLAQTGNGQSGPSAQKTQAKKPAKRYLKNTDNPEFKSNRLTKPVDLVDMPPYPGKKAEFVTGTMFPNVKGGPSVTMQFSMKDDPKKVLEWYKNAFSEYQWQLQSNMAGAKGLAAMKSHNICQVMVVAPSKRDAKCDLLLRYKSYKPTDFSSN